MKDLIRSDAPEAGAMLGILKRNRKTLFVWIGVFTLLGLLINAVMPPIYRATVRLEIRRPNDRSPLTGQSLASAGFQSENVAMFTAAERIKDRVLLGRIADEFSPMGWIRTLPGSALGPSALAARFPLPQDANARPVAGKTPEKFRRSTQDAQVDWLQTIVAVEPVKETRLVDVRVEHRDPEAAQTIADRIAHRFVDEQCRLAADSDTSGLVQLTNQLASMRRSFDIDANNTSAGNEGPELLQSRLRTLSDAAVALNNDVISVRRERAELRARLDRLALGDQAALDVRGITAGEDVALGTLQHDLEACRVQLASARQIYKDKHPRLVSLESQYAALQEAFKAEQHRAAARLHDEDAILAARERAADSARLRNDHALRMAEAQFDHSSASHSELKAAQDLYAVLVNKIQQSRVEELLKSRPVEIVNAATVAPHPVRPRKALNLAVFMFTGLLLGSGQVLVRHSSRNTLSTPEEVEAELDLPVLGTIPKRD